VSSGIRKVPTGAAIRWLARPAISGSFRVLFASWQSSKVSIVIAIEWFEPFCELRGSMQSQDKSQQSEGHVNPCRGGCLPRGKFVVLPETCLLWRKHGKRSNAESLTARRAFDVHSSISPHATGRFACRGLPELSTDSKRPFNTATVYAPNAKSWPITENSICSTLLYQVATAARIVGNDRGPGRCLL